MLVLPEVLTLREASTTLQMLEQSMRADRCGHAHRRRVGAAQLRHRRGGGAVGVPAPGARVEQRASRCAVRRSSWATGALVRRGVAARVRCASGVGSPSRPRVSLATAPRPTRSRRARSSRSPPPAPGAGSVGARRVGIVRPRMQHRLDPAPGLLLLVAAHEQVQTARRSHPSSRRS